MLQETFHGQHHPKIVVSIDSWPSHSAITDCSTPCCNKSIGGSCRGNVLGQQVVHAVRAQTTSACVWEYRLIRELVWLFHPRREDGPSVFAKRRTLFLASFANHTHVRAGPPRGIDLGALQRVAHDRADGI
jgi:hypothetical protein